MSLAYIGQQVTIYGGVFIVISGIIGNGMNILVFSSVRTYRNTPCTFYFPVGSINNIVYISIILITRILSTGFGIDLSHSSIIWCRIRQYLIPCFNLTSFSCLCLASIDQFLVTSQSAKLRRISSIKWAHRIVLIVIIACCLHGIPCLLFYNISPITKSCVNTSAAYAIYLSIYLLALVCSTSSLILIVFGYLTYRNIHRKRVLLEQQADRQLVKMTLIQVILVVTCMLPYGLNSAYNVITSQIIKESNRLVIENFIQAILTLLPFINFGGGFYMFLISSSRFRRAVRDRLFCRPKLNQIVPFQPPTIGTRTLENNIQNKQKNIL